MRGWRALHQSNGVDIIANTASAGLFAFVLLLASQELLHETVASRLLDYSLALIGAWLLTLGAPTRYVSFAVLETKLFARAVWQTVIGVLVMGGILAMLAWLMLTTPHEGRLWSVAIAAIPVITGYIGREVSNITFGRLATSLQCLVQASAGAILSVVGYQASWWSGDSALTLFLIFYYANGSIQLFAFLVLNRPLMSDFRLYFLRETGRSNLALGLSTLLLGNFDKLLLSLRPVLNGAESAYLIADRLAGAYGTAMTYYTQSRVQSVISQRIWAKQRMAPVIDDWFRRALKSVFVFSLVGGIAIAVGGVLLRWDIQPAVAAGFVVAICLTLHLKNASGYAIRLLDTLHSRYYFNKVALILIMSVLLGLSLCLHSRIEIIIIIKLALHAIMFQMLRWVAFKEEAGV